MFEKFLNSEEVNYICDNKTIYQRYKPKLL